MLRNINTSQPSFLVGIGKVVIILTFLLCYVVYTPLHLSSESHHVDTHHTSDVTYGSEHHGSEHEPHHIQDHLYDWMVGKLSGKTFEASKYISHSSFPIPETPSGADYGILMTKSPPGSVSIRLTLSRAPPLA